MARRSAPSKNSADFDSLMTCSSGGSGGPAGVGRVDVGVVIGGVVVVGAVVLLDDVNEEGAEAVFVLLL